MSFHSQVLPKRGCERRGLALCQPAGAGNHTRRMELDLAAHSYRGLRVKRVVLRRGARTGSAVRRHPAATTATSRVTRNTHRHNKTKLPAPGNTPACGASEACVSAAGREDVRTSVWGLLAEALERCSTEWALKSSVPRRASDVRAAIIRAAKTKMSFPPRRDHRGLIPRPSASDGGTRRDWHTPTSCSSFVVGAYERKLGTSYFLA